MSLILRGLKTITVVPFLLIGVTACSLILIVVVAYDFINDMWR